MRNDEPCVVCGRYLPEGGRMVCPQCEKEFLENSEEKQVRPNVTIEIFLHNCESK